MQYQEKQRSNYIGTYMATYHIERQQSNIPHRIPCKSIPFIEDTNMKQQQHSSNGKTHEMQRNNSWFQLTNKSNSRNNGKPANVSTTLEINKKWCYKTTENLHSSDELATIHQAVCIELYNMGMIVKTVAFETVTQLGSSNTINGTDGIRLSTAMCDMMIICYKIEARYKSISKATRMQRNEEIIVDNNFHNKYKR